MDGTGVLFERFLRAAPRWARCVVVRYPVDVAVGYEGLERRVMEVVPREERFLVVAESFSGAVGAGICAKGMEGCIGLVLVNSFVTPPGGGLLKVLPWKMVFGLPMAGHGIRLAMMNGRSETTVGEVMRAGDMVDRGVLAFRAGLIARLDAREAMRRVSLPVLVLRGLSDRLVGRGKAREMERLNGRVVVKEIGGPHLLLQARPKESWEAIEGWVEERVDV